MSYWTAEYKCMNVAAVPAAAGPSLPPAHSRPRVLRRRNWRSGACVRADRVIQAMSNGLPFLDRNSWMANLPNTPGAIHQPSRRAAQPTLVAQSIAFQRQVAAYRTIIDLGNRVRAGADAAGAGGRSRRSRGLPPSSGSPGLRAVVPGADRQSRQGDPADAGQSARLLAAIKADQRATRERRSWFCCRPAPRPPPTRPDRGAAAAGQIGGARPSRVVEPLSQWASRF